MVEILIDHIALSTFEAIAVEASTFLNIGPAFDFAGLNGNYVGFSRFNEGRDSDVDVGWVHRIVPVLVIFTRAFWRS